MKTITILNSDVFDELNKKYSTEFAKDFTFHDNRIKIKKDDRLYLFSFFLAEVIIEKYISNILPNENCKIILTRLVYQYLLENSEINPEGFLNFRAKFFFSELNKQVEEENRKKNVEREYNEFVNILKYYIAVQAPKFNEIKVIFYETGFKILDETGNDITESTTSEFIYSTRNNDDLLISTLIFLAPKRLYFENFNKLKNVELKKTLSDIFKNRIIDKSKTNY